MVTTCRALAIKVLLAVCLMAFTGVTRGEELRRPDREQVRSQLRRSPRFAAPSVSQPAAFQVSYTLPRVARVSVTLLDLALMPLRTFHVALGEPGARAGENTLTVWDGRDSRGIESPPGEYLAALSFQYEDGTLQNKRFRIVKP